MKVKAAASCPGRTNCWYTGVLKAKNQDTITLNMVISKVDFTGLNTENKRLPESCVLPAVRGPLNGCPSDFFSFRLSKWKSPIPLVTPRCPFR